MKWGARSGKWEVGRFESNGAGRKFECQCEGGPRPGTKALLCLGASCFNPVCCFCHSNGSRLHSLTCHFQLHTSSVHFPLRTSTSHVPRQTSNFEMWAHQDSNLGRAGYEPAALTAELWAHYSLQSAVGNRQSESSVASIFDGRLELPTQIVDCDSRFPTADRRLSTSCLPKTP